MTNFMRRHDALQMSTLLEAAENRREQVSVGTMEDDVRKLAGLVMTDIALKTSDRALRIVMSVAESDNGFEAWRLLCKKGEGGGAYKRTGLLNTILKHDF